MLDTAYLYSRFFSSVFIAFSTISISLFLAVSTYVPLNLLPTSLRILSLSLSLFPPYKWNIHLVKWNILRLTAKQNVSNEIISFFSTFFSTFFSMKISLSSNEYISNRHTIVYSFESTESGSAWMHKSIFSHNDIFKCEHPNENAFCHWIASKIIHNNANVCVRKRTMHSRRQFPFF